jgi:hypothetical protein
LTIKITPAMAAGLFDRFGAMRKSRVWQIDTSDSIKKE